jgi:hypothetical protein
MGSKLPFLEHHGTRSRRHFLFWKLMPPRQKRELHRRLQFDERETLWS